MTRERYRRLPGRRRGIFSGASVWAGSDHLLAVRSLRFREEYKRFYLRDVQAIAVARQPRFHVPVQAVVAGVPMLVLYLMLRSLWGWADAAFWSLAGVSAAVWAIVSLGFSCRCRIYTAVSRDELPSVYRTWTARRFLAKVEPLIAQAQGTLDGDWTEVAEPKGVGPAPEPPPPPPVPEQHAEPAVAAFVPKPAAALPIDKTAAYIFIASLLVDAGVSAAALRWESRTALWMQLATALARVAAAIWIFVQRHRKRVRPGMQRLAIVSLVATGLLFYVQQVLMQIATANNPGTAATRWPLLSQIDIGASVVLAAIGLVMVVRSEP